MTITMWRADRVWGWLGPIGTAVLAFVLRVWNVGHPNKFIFDETYYAKDAYSLLQHGYVQDFTEGANAQIVRGDLAGVMTGEPSWIVHPDGGKWVIALGEWLFGFDSFGWRISGVVVGALTVLVLARLVRRLTGSTVVGCIAGLLLAVDGMHFVMSRLALLDVFLTFWLVCAVACLAADRDWIRGRLDRYRFVRPWQLLAGVSFGMACATKWSGLYVLAAFGLLTVVWEVLARRRAGWRDGWLRTTLMTGAPAFVSLVIVALLVYLVTWTGFLLHHEVYEARFGRGYGDYSAPWGDYVDHPSKGLFGEVLDAFRSLWHFHVMTYGFHTNDLNSATHPYQSNPAGWLVQWRPVGADAQFDLPATTRCGQAAGETCVREILILGNPLIWWSGVLALVGSVVAWIRTRSGTWGIPVVAVLACWLPWFQYADRPIFSFYAVTCVPFMIIAICLLINALIRTGSSPRHRYAIALAIGIYVVAAVVTFWYFHPLYTDELIPYGAWRDRMWWSRWI
ncbi:dolichyl-phosphate-mannose--protein mannosyltransferase [Aeromicrobium wangtongii]|uniref:Polyprenol-phosphate-mannose--protein mannosyltransferase n=1 Tax=Aeromicrobium wangtongii TaxID=2969247 RepID=A0ABY5MC73_9ACTN|nr:phospholipid carrier-dependent glycosyltransferase [Aeromicrobium wangtongii]MCD9196828.1 phospholipid carrier-dependent glycosyltransferase [Aeromicrobium wangtongii]UUP14337.1 phospholipid carrier-dependent glycosyltransferase [Aeromicrobium wangtongii]